MISTYDFETFWLYNPHFWHKNIPFGVSTPPFFDHFETFWSFHPRRVRRVSHTHFRQLSLPLRASEVAFGSEVHCVSEVSPDGEVRQT